MEVRVLRIKPCRGREGERNGQREEPGSRLSQSLSPPHEDLRRGWPFRVVMKGCTFKLFPSDYCDHIKQSQGVGCPKERL